MSKKGSDIDGNDAEKDARFREKVERFTTRLNNLILTLLKGIAWILSAIFMVVIVLLFVAIYYTIFDIQALNSASFLGIDLLIQYVNLFTPQTITYGLAMAAFLLICITYLIVVFLLKRRPNRWFILGLTTLCIALIVCAITNDNVSLTPREGTNSVQQTTECFDPEVKSGK